MPRPERPVDPSAGPVPRFAAELRKLRAEAGGPTYREMAQHAHASKASLSAAARGHRLPTWEVTKAYVRACGGDVDDWHGRWTVVRDEVAPVPAVPGKRRYPRPAVMLVAVATMVILGATLAAWATSGDVAAPVGGALTVPTARQPATGRTGPDPALPAPEPGSPQPTARFPRASDEVPQDNADPKQAGCADDPTTIRELDRVQVNTLNENLLGVAVLRYSPACHASWGRFEPSARLTYLPGPARITIIAHRPATGTVGTAYSTTFDGQPVFGNILLDSTGCVEITVQVEAPDGGGQATTHCLRG